MSNISTLRKLVNNGWTKTNINTLKKQVGNENYSEIVKQIKNADSFTLDIPESSGVITYFQYFPETIQKAVNTFKPRTNVPWSRPVHLGKGNWNSEQMQHFRDIRTGRDNIPKDVNKSTEVRRLFDSLEPLGCDEIRYRGECYLLDTPASEHFDKLKNLKVGDVYVPRSNFYTSSDIKEAEHFSLHPGLKNYSKEKCGQVVYQILVPPEAKVIENAIKGVSETILDDRAGYRIIDKVLEGDLLKIKCEQIPNYPL